MLKQVVLAPVPWVHLESIEKEPHLRQRVAFGTSSLAVTDEYTGLPIFIYGSEPHHDRHIRGVVTWTGMVDKIERAVKGGPRDGKHPDRNIRPLTAENGDTAFIYFLEVTGITLLERRLPVGSFTKQSGKGKPFTGSVPQWPVLAYLDYSSDKQVP